MSQVNERQKILIESGTNELEVLVFRLGPTQYGVNVAKVREVIGHVDIVKVPKAHHAVVGVFKLREAVIPLIDLQLYFDPRKPSDATERPVILMEFNGFQIGFLVDHVERIFRLSWRDVQDMPQVQKNKAGVIISVCQADEKLTLMVDFEKIVFDINGDGKVFAMGAQAVAAEDVDRSVHHVLLAEDSPTIRQAIETNLVEAGFGQVTCFGNGADAWSALEAATVADVPFTFVVTDIEMPQMDGLHLCKRVKEHPALNHLPVVVFSSLVSDDNLKKCREVGADAALTKPQMAQLVELLDDLLSNEGAPAPEEASEMMVLAE